MAENVKEVEKNATIDKPKKPTEKDLRYEADRDKEMVHGVFKNHERPGEKLEFWFRGHKGHEIEKITLYDGEYTKIPLGVARHLNKNCYYTIDQYALDPKSGTPSVEAGKKVRRFSFYTTSYSDLEDLSEVGVPCMPESR